LVGLGPGLKNIPIIYVTLNLPANSFVSFQVVGMAQIGVFSHKQIL
jgi:hypothetical protein